MRRYRGLIVTVLGVWAAAAWAQGVPHVGYVYPAGGRQGTTLSIVVGGQQLRGVNGVYVSGEGVRATVGEYVRPLSPNELGDTAWFLRELVRRRWSARVMDYERQSSDPPVLPDHPWLRDLDHKTPGELARLRTALFDPRKQLNTQLAEQVVVEVMIASGAAPGARELRLLTPGGVSNPLRFEIGVLREVREEKLGAEAVTDLAQPVVLNGQITPGEVDRFTLRAHQGQRLLFRAQARALVPYLADAVPGWFQAVMVLREAQGREVAAADDYRFDPDPVLCYEVPAEGEYTLEIRDSIYRGRDDFVYRITVGELPFATALFPLGGREGQSVTATVSGWNLPPQPLALDTTPGGPATRLLHLPTGTVAGNELPYAVDTFPEITVGDATGVQPVSLPVIVNGRLSKPGAVVSFQLNGSAGEEIVAEVRARRLGSPLDAQLTLSDVAGAILATNDDTEDRTCGLLTSPADPYLRFRLPAAGQYTVMLTDTEGAGGAEYAYRLRLSAPRPDFAIYVTPCGVSLAPGRSATVTAHVLRQEGFSGEVELSLIDPPVGYTLSGGRLSADQDKTEIRLSAAREVKPQTFILRLQARGQSGDKIITHAVIPAEAMMQAFAYWHLVPAREFLVTAPGPRPVPAVWRPLAEGFQSTGVMPLRLPLDGSAELPVKITGTLPQAPWATPESLRFVVAAAPRGVVLAGSVATTSGVTLTFRADGNMARAGGTGNVILEVLAPPDNREATGEQATRVQRVSLGVLPPLAVQIVR